MNAMNHFLQAFAERFDWIAMFDVDEFVQLPPHVVRWFFFWAVRAQK